MIKKTYLKDIREKKRITAKQIAEAVGISTSAISQYESEKTDYLLSLENTQRAANYLGITVEELETGTIQPKFYFKKEYLKQTLEVIESSFKDHIDELTLDQRVDFIDDVYKSVHDIEERGIGEQDYKDILKDLENEAKNQDMLAGAKRQLSQLLKRKHRSELETA